MDKVNEREKEKNEYIKLEFFMNPDNSGSKYSKQFSIFKDGCPKE
jgi:hypothetical protein